MLYKELAFARRLKFSLMSMKTEKQEISETLLLLRILQKDDNIDGSLKLQKEVFLTEQNLLRSQLGVLCYKYFRYTWGPYSKELAEKFKSLAERGFVHKTTYTLTERGIYLLEFVDGILRDYRHNSKIFEIVDSTVAKYKRYSGPQLTNIVYNTEVEAHDSPGKELKVKDIPVFTDIFVPEDFEHMAGLEFPPALLHALKAELSMDKETWESLPEKKQNALRRAKKQLLAAIAN